MHLLQLRPAAPVDRHHRRSPVISITFSNPPTPRQHSKPIPDPCHCLKRDRCLTAGNQATGVELYADDELTRFYFARFPCNVRGDFGVKAFTFIPVRAQLRVCYR
jgi:hypothetical protein